MNDKWMKDLSNFGRHYKRKAPDGLLDDIKREMSARRLMPVSVSTSPRLIPHRRRLAVAATIVVLMGVGTMLYLSTGSRRDTVSVPNVTSAVPLSGSTDTSAPTVSTPHLTSPTTVHDAGRLATVAPSRGIGSTLASMTRHLVGIVSADTNTTDHTNAQPLIVRSDPAPTPPVIDTPPTSAPPRPNAAHTPHTTAPTLLAHTPTSQTTHGTWQVSAHYSGQARAGTSEHGNMRDMTVMLSAPHFDTPPELNKRETANIPLATLPPTRRERHHRPIKVGVAVDVPLGGRWSLHTGLTYSRLTSEITEETPVATTQTSQKLHYVGIPLSLCYRLWQGGAVGIYTKAGATVEQLVSGKAVSHHTEGINTKPPTTTKISEHRPVMSTHAAMGIDYRPHPAISIFAEPGAECYFKNGSGIRSSYTNKSLHFNLSVGMRVNIK